MTKTLADLMLLRSPVTSLPYSPQRAGDFYLPRAALTVVDVFAKLGEPLERWRRAWERRAQRREAIGELSALDDRMLHDIGLGRSEIPAAVDAALEENNQARVEGIWRR